MAVCWGPISSGETRQDLRLTPRARPFRGTPTCPTPWRPQDWSNNGPTPWPASTTCPATGEESQALRHTLGGFRVHVAASRFTKQRCEMDLRKRAAPSVSHAERCKQATQSLPGFGSGDAGGRPSTVTAVTSPDSGLPSNVKEELRCRRRGLLTIKHENLNIWSSSPRKM